jgi:hypothetical protein
VYNKYFYKHVRVARAFPLVLYKKILIFMVLN